MHPSGSSCSSSAPYLSIPHHQQHHQHAAGDAAAHLSKDTEVNDGRRFAVAPTGAHSHVDFKSYVSRIIWEADNDCEAFPPDSYHVWCVEGSGSSVGSLSSLGSAASRRSVTLAEEEDEEEDEGGFANDRLSQWGPKFQVLSDMYDRPQLALIQRHHDFLPHLHS